jgi:uncharacterized GH25 family protein
MLSEALNKFFIQRQYMQLSKRLWVLVTMVAFTSMIVAGCANHNSGYARQNTFDPTPTNHPYTLTVVDAAGKPIQGARVEWTMESNGANKQTKSASTDFAIVSPTIKWADYKSEVKYVVSKDGYYNRNGSMSESTYRTDTGGAHIYRQVQ